MDLKKVIIFFVLVSFTLIFCFCTKKTKVNVTNLRCELLENPIGLDVSNPRLSWEITCNERDVRQLGYHVIVSSSLGNLNKNRGDLWDSGQVNSEESVQIRYEGSKLNSRAVCYWKVRINTNKGESGWSKPALWTMAFLEADDWQARWIGLDKAFEQDSPDVVKTRLSARYLRKEFSAPSKIRKAVAYISGLGCYKMFLNGKIVGNQELSPSPTDYRETVMYNIFDVTGFLNKGENTIGTILGNGRYFSVRREPSSRYDILHFGFPKMIFQLEIEYETGKKEIIISDNSWKITADGPIRSNNEFDGEEYDANKEMQGWNKQGFDTQTWMSAELVDAPGGKLRAQLNRNIRTMETIQPVAITNPQPDMYVLDMGQNMVGWLQIKVKGQKNEQVVSRFAESVNPDGTIYTKNLRTADATDKYTLKGEKTEVWEPAFVYHGFRYVEVTGFPTQPKLSDFKGKVLYDDMETTGYFETSDSLINRIYKNAYWGISGNYKGVPLDCPQRDERMGWLGDRTTGSWGESYMFNISHLYNKWLDDIKDAQKESGSIPDVVPAYWNMYRDNMSWPGAYITIANMLWKQYGDKEVVARNYPSMKKWLYYMKDNYLVDDIMTKDRYGDWCVPPESPEIIFSNDPGRITEGALIASAYYYYLLHLMADFAGLLELPEDAGEYSYQAEKTKNAFNKWFFDYETEKYSNNTVTANLLPLFFDMVPDGYNDVVFQNIVEKTINDFNGHVSTGLVGTQFLMRTLSKYGRTDLAYRITTNRSYPGWGFMIENGATTIWELWNGNTANPAMNSANHVMLLGDLIIWYYEYLAGIRQSPESTGFKEIVFKPYIPKDLRYVNVSFNSIHGLIKSSWCQDDKGFHWDITVPCNTKATVYIPVMQSGIIREGNLDINSIEEIKVLEKDDNYTVVEVPSGNYRFKSM